MINHIIKKLRQQLPNIYKVKVYKKIKKDKSIVTKSDKMIQNIIISELKKKLKDKFYLISEEKKNIKINRYSKF